jgi:hypothetical protein
MTFKLSRILVTALIDFAGFMAMFWLISSFEGISRLGIYTLAFILIAAIFHSSEWLACRILELLRIKGAP